MTTWSMCFSASANTPLPTSTCSPPGCGRPTSPPAPFAPISTPSESSGQSRRWLNACEGPAVGALIGLPEVKATLVTLRTPDGQGVELDKFHTPVAVRSGPESAPVNALGLRRIMFEVDEIDAVVSRMLKHGADLIGEMNYDDTYQLAYLRGPEGIIVALAEQLK